MIGCGSTCAISRASAGRRGWCGTSADGGAARRCATPGHGPRRRRGGPPGGRHPAANRHHSTIYATGLVDLQRRIVIDMVEGNSAADLRRWLAAADPEWLAGIEVVATDLARELPSRLVPGPRCAHGMRSFEHCRLRVLLHTGGVTWPSRPCPPRIRTRAPTQTRRAGLLRSGWVRSVSRRGGGARRRLWRRTPGP
jgi:hypothetical protein